MIALDHDPTVIGKPGQNRQRGFRIEDIAFVQIRHARIRFAEGGNLPVDIDAEGAAHIARHLEDVLQDEGVQFQRLGLELEACGVRTG